MGSPLVLALAPGESPSPAYDEPWVTPDLLGLAAGQFDEAVDLDQVCRFASHVMFILSGRKYGVRTETIRPQAGMRSIGWGIYSLPDIARAVTLGDVVFDGPPYLVLKAPVRAITSVKVDGTVLDPSTYTLYSNRRLVRLALPGKSSCWPLCQRLDLPDTEKGTFSVTYQWGRDVPPDGMLAAQVFATELAKYVNKKPCALADRAVTVTRQGVTQTVLDPSQFIKMGRTGLFLTDIWLGTVNPNGQRQRATITSPESVQRVRQT